MKLAVSRGFYETGGRLPQACVGMPGAGPQHAQGRRAQATAENGGCLDAARRRARIVAHDLSRIDPPRGKGSRRQGSRGTDGVSDGVRRGGRPLVESAARRLMVAARNFLRHFIGQREPLPRQIRVGRAQAWRSGGGELLSFLGEQAASFDALRRRKLFPFVRCEKLSPPERIK